MIKFRRFINTLTGHSALKSITPSIFYITIVNGVLFYLLSKDEMTITTAKKYSLKDDRADAKKLRLLSVSPTTSSELKQYEELKLKIKD